jgi:DNA-binding beta-propeller fold protein YncE
VPLGLEYEARVGTEGSGDLQFNRPYGVSVDHELDRMRLADSGNKRIVVMTLRLKFVRALRGSGRGALVQPVGVAAAAGSRILYITDGRKHCVVVMNEEDGTVLRVFGEEGEEPGQLHGPWGIALSEGRLYVVEFGNHRVQVFETDGTPVACYGNGRGSDRDQFKYPRGLAVSGGTLLVADEDNDRIQRLDKSSGRFLGSFCTEGSGEGQLDRPSGVAVAGGRIYIADWGNDRVVVRDQEGKQIGAFGSEGDGDGQFRRPRGVAASGPVLAVCSARLVHQRVTVYSDVQLTRGAKMLRQHLCVETSWMRGQDAVLADVIAELVSPADTRQWK